MSMLMIAALAAAAAAVPAHTTHIEHRGQNLAVEYRPVVETRLRQAGIAPAARPGTQICNWTATVSVERHLGGDAPSQRVGQPHEISGSQAGDCHVQRERIAQPIAARGDDVQAHVAALERTELERARAQPSAPALPKAAAGEKSDPAGTIFDATRTR